MRVERGSDQIASGTRIHAVKMRLDRARARFPIAIGIVPIPSLVVPERWWEGGGGKGLHIGECIDYGISLDLQGTQRKGANRSRPGCCFHCPIPGVTIIENQSALDNGKKISLAICKNRCSSITPGLL